MNNNYIKTIVFALMLFTGCKKDMDLIPKDPISDRTFWKTTSDYKLAANNLYMSLEDFYTNMDPESDMEYDVLNSVSNGS